ncbi:MAG: hypothetical protein WBB27_13665 [Maribacter sp.]
MISLLFSKLTVCFVLLNVQHRSSANQDFLQIQEESKELANAIKDENLQKVLYYMLPGTMILPEYHSSLEDINEIQAYYTTVFDLSDTRRYAKEIIEIQQFGKYFLEIGTFEHEYKIRDKDWFNYKGKYMTWWTGLSNGELKLLANMWGGSSWVEPEYLNFVSVETEDRTPLTPSSGLEHKITESLNYTIEAVKDGDADKQLKSYMDDAIYMTYYDPPFIGKKEITDYFKGHYDPNSIMDSLTIAPHKVIEMGDYSLQMGKYYVEWKQDGKKYMVKGKNLNFRKKMPDGRLMLYRQMVNHSIPPGPKDKSK